MKNNRLEESVHHFVSYLSFISGRFSSGLEKATAEENKLLESLRGVWKELPYGFVDYLDAVVLKPLNKLGLQHIHESEYNALKKIIALLKYDYVPSTGNNAVKARFLEALQPLLREYSKVVLPVEGPSRDYEPIPEDEVTAIFNVVWKRKLTSLFESKDGADTLSECQQQYKTILSRKMKHTPDNLATCQKFLSESVRSHYPAFLQVLTKVSDNFYQRRTKKELARSLRLVVHAYHYFFQSVSEDLLRWFSVQFGQSGECARKHATFFCMVKQHLGVNQLLAVLKELNPILSQSQLYFLDLLKEQIATVSFDSQYEGGEFYSLFYACYAGLFSVVTESARTCYAQAREEDAKNVRQYLKAKVAGPEVIALEVRIKKMTQVLIHSMSYKRLPKWLPKCLGFLLRFVESVIALFVPRLRDVKKRRLSHVRHCADEAVSVLYKNRGADKKHLFWSFYQKVRSASGPMAEHRVSVFSTKHTSACLLVDEAYRQSVLP